ncbi:hypothetical protein [Erwinia mallotivora]|uniref:Uncharacterized protein n=1 Tax=Erwinia mallotivora TaxID=69222 RepID=A0A014N6L4_9GAMM|nr:hypothetical protein [Erwinia mallotivora]EXU75048.1 hypothetical protein BG55_14350 [Erwinia mallotivora]
MYTSSNCTIANASSTSTGISTEKLSSPHSLIQSLSQIVNMPLDITSLKDGTVTVPHQEIKTANATSDIDSALSEFSDQTALISDIEANNCVSESSSLPTLAEKKALYNEFMYYKQSFENPQKMLDELSSRLSSEAMKDIHYVKELKELLPVLKALAGSILTVEGRKKLKKSTLEEINKKEENIREIITISTILSEILYNTDSKTISKNLIERKKILSGELIKRVMQKLSVSSEKRSEEQQKKFKNDIETIINTRPQTILIQERLDHYFSSAFKIIHDSIQKNLRDDIKKINKLARGVYSDIIEPEESINTILTAAGNRILPSPFVLTVKQITDKIDKILTTLDSNIEGVSQILPPFNKPYNEPGQVFYSDGVHLSAFTDRITESALNLFRYAGNTLTDFYHKKINRENLTPFLHSPLRSFSTIQPSDKKRYLVLKSRAESLHADANQLCTATKQLKSAVKLAISSGFQTIPEYKTAKEALLDELNPHAKNLPQAKLFDAVQTVKIVADNIIYRNYDSPFSITPSSLTVEQKDKENKLSAIFKETSGSLDDAANCIIKVVELLQSPVHPGSYASWLNSIKLNIERVLTITVQAPDIIWSGFDSTIGIRRHSKYEYPLKIKRNFQQNFHDISLLPKKAYRPYYVTPNKTRKSKEKIAHFSQIHQSVMPLLNETEKMIVLVRQLDAALIIWRKNNAEGKNILEGLAEKCQSVNLDNINQFWLAAGSVIRKNDIAVYQTGDERRTYKATLSSVLHKQTENIIVAAKRLHDASWQALWEPEGNKIQATLTDLSGQLANIKAGIKGVLEAATGVRIDNNPPEGMVAKDAGEWLTKLKKKYRSIGIPEGDIENMVEDILCYFSHTFTTKDDPKGVLFRRRAELAMQDEENGIIPWPASAEEHLAKTKTRQQYLQSWAEKRITFGIETELLLNHSLGKLFSPVKHSLIAPLRLLKLMLTPLRIEMTRRQMEKVRPGHAVPSSLISEYRSREYFQNSFRLLSMLLPQLPKTIFASALLGYNLNEDKVFRNHFMDRWLSRLPGDAFWITFFAAWQQATVLSVTSGNSLTAEKLFELQHNFESELNTWMKYNENNKSASFIDKNHISLDNLPLLRKIKKSRFTRSLKNENLSLHVNFDENNAIFDQFLEKHYNESNDIDIEKYFFAAEDVYSNNFESKTIFLEKEKKYLEQRLERLLSEKDAFYEKKIANYVYPDSRRRSSFPPILLDDTYENTYMPFPEPKLPENFTDVIESREKRIKSVQDELENVNKQLEELKRHSTGENSEDLKYVAAIHKIEEEINIEPSYLEFKINKLLEIKEYQIRTLSSDPVKNKDEIEILHISIEHLKNRQLINILRNAVVQSYRQDAIRNKFEPQKSYWDIFQAKINTAKIIAQHDNIDIKNMNDESLIDIYDKKIAKEDAEAAEFEYLSMLILWLSNGQFREIYDSDPYNVFLNYYHLKNKYVKDLFSFQNERPSTYIHQEDMRKDFECENRVEYTTQYNDYIDKGSSKFDTENQTPFFLLSLNLSEKELIYPPKSINVYEPIYISESEESSGTNYVYHRPGYLTYIELFDGGIVMISSMNGEFHNIKLSSAELDNLTKNLGMGKDDPNFFSRYCTHNGIEITHNMSHLTHIKEIHADNIRNGLSTVLKIENDKMMESRKLAEESSSVTFSIMSFILPFYREIYYGATDSHHTYDLQSLVLDSAEVTMSLISLGIKMSSISAKAASSIAKFIINNRLAGFPRKEMIKMLIHELPKLGINVAKSTGKAILSETIQILEPIPVSRIYKPLKNHIKNKAGTKFSTHQANTESIGDNIEFDKTTSLHTSHNNTTAKNNIHNESIINQKNSKYRYYKTKQKNAKLKFESALKEKNINILSSSEEKPIADVFLALKEKDYDPKITTFITLDNEKAVDISQVVTVEIDEVTFFIDNNFSKIKPDSLQKSILLTESEWLAFYNEKFQSTRNIILKKTSFNLSKTKQYLDKVNINKNYSLQYLNEIDDKMSFVKISTQRLKLIENQSAAKQMLTTAITQDKITDNARLAPFSEIEIRSKLGNNPSSFSPGYFTSLPDEYGILHGIDGKQYLRFNENFYHFSPIESNFKKGTLLVGNNKIDVIYLKDSWVSDDMSFSGKWPVHTDITMPNIERVNNISYTTCDEKYI